MTSIFRDRTTSKPCLRHEATVSVDLDGDQIADLFCCADNYQMARFFSRIAENYKRQGASFPLQLEYTRQNSGLTKAGREVMQQIGECAE